MHDFVVEEIKNRVTCKSDYWLSNKRLAARSIVTW